jgi:hypothetical protein
LGVNPETPKLIENDFEKGLDESENSSIIK